MATPVERKLLIIETSGHIGHVAVARDSEICGRRQLDYARRHARDLAPAVRDLFREQGWRTADITAVFVSLGPGSYTGLRVGIMSAKAFAYATGCAILGIETFAAITLNSNVLEQWSDGSKPILTVIADAQQDKVYSQSFAFSADDGMPETTSALVILPATQWLNQLAPGARISGPGLRQYRERLPEHVQVVPEAEWDPRPEGLLRLGLACLARGERDDCWTLEPLYLRPSSAEEKKLAAAAQAEQSTSND